MFTHLSILVCVPTHGKLSLILNIIINSSSIFSYYVVSLVGHVIDYFPIHICLLKVNAILLEASALFRYYL